MEGESLEALRQIQMALIEGLLTIDEHADEKRKILCGTFNPSYSHLVYTTGGNIMSHENCGACGACGACVACGACGICGACAACAREKPAEHLKPNDMGETETFDNDVRQSKTESPDNLEIPANKESSDNLERPANKESPDDLENPDNIESLEKPEESVIPDAPQIPQTFQRPSIPLRPQKAEKHERYDRHERIVTPDMPTRSKNSDRHGRPCERDGMATIHERLFRTTRAQIPAATTSTVVIRPPSWHPGVKEWRYCSGHVQTTVYGWSGEFATRQSWDSTKGSLWYRV